MKKLVLLFLLIPLSCGVRSDKNLPEHSAVEEGYLEKGKAIVELTQPILLQNVTKAMQEGGPGHAIDFCHLRALDIKDSLSRVYHCEIKRIALKYRNPADRPQSGLDREMLQLFLDSIADGKHPAPRVHVMDDRAEYYQAIRIGNGACLVCHGEPGTQISPETMAMIQDRYPNDLATGFALNDFRGAWKISFFRSDYENNVVN